MHQNIAFLLVLTFTACGPDTAKIDQSAPREISDPYVADTANASPFLGSWESEGRVLVSVTLQRDGSVKVVPGETPGWDAVINNVRIEGKSLCYDQYHYFLEDGSPEMKPLKRHPFSGVRNEYELVPGDSPDELVFYSDSRLFPGRPIKLQRVR